MSVSAPIRPSVLYLRNIGLFLVVAIPVAIIVDVVVEIAILGMFPNPYTSLMSFLESVLVNWYVFGGPGGILLSIIHTFLVFRRRAQPGPTLLRRSIFCALLLGTAYGVFLSVVLLLIFGGGGFFILPGVLVYAWLVARFTARRQLEPQSSSPG